MTRMIRGSRAAVLAAALAVVLAPAAVAAEDEGYVPFVTDFPKPAGAQQFIPFVTDFGMEPRPPGRTVVIGPVRPPSSPAPVPAPAPEPTAGRSWADVALGAASGLALGALLVLGVVGARRARGWGEGPVPEGRPTAGAAGS